MKPGVEPHPARPLERAGDGEERNRKPLRKVGGRRHRGAGARLQREPAVPPHRGQQVGELGRRQAGDRGGGTRVEALDGGAQLVDMRRVGSEVLEVGAVPQELPDQEREQGVVRAGPQGPGAASRSSPSRSGARR